MASTMATQRSTQQSIIHNSDDNDESDVMMLPVPEYRAYESLQPCSNKLLTKKWDDLNRKRHREKLRSVKSTIDNSAPRHFNHLCNKAKKIQLEEDRLTNIERDNRILLEKMSSIMRTTGRVQNNNNYIHRSLNHTRRLREVERITTENQKILHRISNKQPHYSHFSWQEDRDKNEEHLRNISRYGVMKVHMKKRSTPSRLEPLSREYYSPTQKQTVQGSSSTEPIVPISSSKTSLGLEGEHLSPESSFPKNDDSSTMSTNSKLATPKAASGKASQATSVQGSIADIEGANYDGDINDVAIVTEQPNISKSAPKPTDDRTASTTEPTPVSEVVKTDVLSLETASVTSVEMAAEKSNITDTVSTEEVKLQQPTSIEKPEELHPNNIESDDDAPPE